MKRFFNLKFADKFSVDGIVYQKENFFSAVRSLGTRDDWAGDAPLYRRYYPWSKVETVEVPKALSTVSFPNLKMVAPGAVIFVAPPPLGTRRRGEIPREVYESSKKFSSDPTNYGERTGPSA